MESELSDQKTFRELDVFFRSEYLHAAKFVGGRKLSGFRQNKKLIETSLDTALAHFADRALAEITFADLETYKKAIAAIPKKYGGVRSVADVNQNLRRLRRLFNVAIEQGWLAANPFTRGKGLIGTSFETERTRTLTPAEEKRLLAKCTGRREYLQAIIIFAIETAVRRGELLAVKWSDVNLATRTIRVKNKYTNIETTRLVPISARLRETLAKLRHNQLKPRSPVFNVVDFKKGFRAACDEAKLADLHFHDLRHTAITRMLEAGISPPLVMKISGHTQQKTFLRYVNQSEASVYEIALKLDAAA